MKHYVVVLTLALLSACHEDEISAPESRVRVESVSLGRFQYRKLRYDLEGKISEVVHGFVADGDSAETVFRVYYLGNRIDKISSTDGNQEFRYGYTNGNLTVTKEYTDGSLRLVSTFYYDASDRVELWVSRQASGDELTPLSRKAYRYDESGNTISMELENYDPVTKGHALVSTSKYLDFDDRKNSGSLFVNFSNPYHIQFQNNPRRWRVELTNGSVGETHYEYEYNAAGYTTAERDVAGASEVTYVFGYY